LRFSTLLHGLAVGCHTFGSSSLSPTPISEVQQREFVVHCCEAWQFGITPSGPAFGLPGQHCAQFFRVNKEEKG